MGVRGGVRERRFWEGFVAERRIGGGRGGGGRGRGRFREGG